MGAYLTDHRPVRDQWYHRRNRPLTGCTVLHTSEGVMDTVGADTGTDTLAAFVRNRTTPGSYHDIADSDSNLHLIDYNHGAYHDATGSNNWALSISFVCRTVDWDRMSAERRRGFLRQGALAFARQQEYRKSVGAPLTELRRITKAQSDRGESGFIYHGDRDPGRRTDPGVAPPNDFPFQEFVHECAIALGIREDDDMPVITSEKHFQDQVYTAVRNLIRDMFNGDNDYTKGPFQALIAGAVAPQIAGLQGEIAGLKSALGQLAEAPSQAVDLTSVFEAAKRGGAEGAEQIIDSLRVVADPDA